MKDQQIYLKKRQKKIQSIFFGTTNLEKFINTQLSDFFCFIEKVNDNKFLSKEASNKLLDFISDDLDKSDALEQALARLARAFLANANK